MFPLFCAQSYWKSDNYCNITPPYFGMFNFFNTVRRKTAILPHGLRKTAFRIAKGNLPHPERPPFTMQKTAFYNTLATNTLRKGLVPVAQGTGNGGGKNARPAGFFTSESMFSRLKIIIFASEIYTSNGREQYKFEQNRRTFHTWFRSVFELVRQKIMQIRNCQVILDADIAALYGVETKRVNEAVKTIPTNFPKVTCSNWRKKKRLICGRKIRPQTNSKP